MFISVTRKDGGTRAVGWIALFVALLSASVAGTLRASDPPLYVGNARISPAAAGGTTAAYARLRNGGGEPLTIVAVSSPDASAVEIHRMQHQGDLMRMELLRELTVPARGEVALVAQGLHLMVIGVKRTLAVGERVPLRFTLRDGRQVDASALVVAWDGSR